MANLEPSMTLQQLQTKIQREHFYGAELCRDPDCRVVLDATQTLQELDLNHGDLIYCKVQTMDASTTNCTSTDNHTWQCKVCTFINNNNTSEGDSANNVCSVCGTPVARAGKRDRAELSRSSSSNHVTNRLSDEAMRRNTKPKSGAVNDTQHSLDQPEQITLLSLNVAEFQPSVSAPYGYDPMRDFEREILQHKPDILCLQEVPAHYLSTFLSRHYACVGHAPSHCGNAVVLVRTDWASHVIPMHTSSAGTGLPVVLVQLQFANTNTMVVGSCHLAPFNTGAADRMEQMKCAMSMLTNTDKVIIAGDYNMRKPEDAKFEKTFSLKDAWKEAGSKWQNQYTWDSLDHTAKNPETGTYNCYHDGGFGFKCRFDRIYYRGNLSVSNFALVANKPIGGSKRHFLSDHFGMVATISLVD
jgi:endonuclease/exonuclease/phosphatase family metal-dependent hydrolase